MTGSKSCVPQLPQPIRASALDEACRWRGRRRGRPGHVSWAAFALLSLTLSACEGDNLFRPDRGDPADVSPPVVRVLQPVSAATIPLQDSILVEVRASALAGVARIDFSGVAYRGDRHLGTDFIATRFEPKVIEFSARQPQDTTVRRYLRRLPDETSEHVAIIATVTGAAGTVSSDTVAVYLGGPRVVIEHPAQGDEVRAGRNLAVRLVLNDPDGLTGYQIDYAGVTSGRIVGTFSPARTVAHVDTVIPLPTGASGPLTLNASAENTLSMTGRSGSVTIQVTSQAPPDVLPPSLAVDVVAGARMEMTDSLRVIVTARDNEGGSGLARIGITALALTGLDTLLHRDSVVFVPLRGGTVTREFRLPPLGASELTLPDTIAFRITAFAYDSAGNCAAAVTRGMQQLSCQSAHIGGHQATVATNAAGQPADVIVVAGLTVRLPDGGAIADAVVDSTRQKLYLSNYGANRVEALDLSALRFGPPIMVGSQPWGMFLNAASDTLVVANSGGTNISFVGLHGTAAEDPSRRLSTPNTVLYELRISVDAAGRERLSWSFIDFSDRPQFIAQDIAGRLLYSTRPTGAASPGTIRVVTPPTAEDAMPETQLLFGHDAVRADNSSVVVAHVDSIQVFASDGGDIVEIFTHAFGYPHDQNKVIRSGRLPLGQAIAAIEERGGAIYARSGRWDLSRIALSDTTFVAASADRRWIAFGEGAKSPTGRILLWNAMAGTVSNAVAVTDLVNNASERVNGLGLNRDGSLGVARGQRGAYFFNAELRLQGVFQQGLEAGGAGAALHPANTVGAGAVEERLSMVGTARQTIRLIDTFHFTGRGEIHIRDNIVGPLQAGPALPEDNNGFGHGDPRRVLFRLYGVTAEGVVIVKVRQRDLRLE
jgi:hypothetical protein